MVYYKNLTQVGEKDLSTSLNTLNMFIVQLTFGFICLD